MLRKLLVVFFLFLIIVIVGELAFYLCYMPRHNPSGVGQASGAAKVKDDNYAVISDLFKKRLTAQETEFMRNMLVLNYEDRAFEAFTMQSELRGTLLSVASTPGQLSPGAKFQTKFDIKLENGKTLPMYYSAQDMSVVSVKTASGSGTGSSLSFGNLKEGDKLSIKETYDLRSLRLISADILKLD